MNEKLDVDLVYLWVDGSDPVWLAKRDAFSCKVSNLVELNSTLAIGHGHLKYVRRKETIRINIYKPDYDYYFNRYHPKLFCMNDATRKDDLDRQRAKEFLAQHFPTKSTFEL